MSLRLIYHLLCYSVALLLPSCETSTDLPLMSSTNQSTNNEGNALYQKAKQADDAGKQSRAIKLYDETATDYPSSEFAHQARFRQAELLEKTGKPLKAFEAYQLFLTRFQASNLYSAALAKQADIAHAAAKGSIQNSFLGIPSNVDIKKVAEMLGQVRDNAPKTPTAAKAQITIGEIYQRDKQFAQSIDAYRQLVRDQPDSSETPEALFRVGIVFIEQADDGNRNQATLDLAREAFNDYLNQYPGHFHNAEARKLLANLSSRELQSTFDVAEYYFKTRQHASAKVYYKDVMTRSQSGKLHDAARARLKQLGE
jgi:outer membrane protein assembly factor BamD (BamD/ComL family)